MSESELNDRLKIEEYKSCRDLISKNIEIIEKSEIYAVGAAAASAAFSLSNKSDALVAHTSAWIPLLITAIGLFRYIGIDETMHIINDYLENIEKETVGTGWTSFYRDKNKRWLKSSRFGIWFILGLFSVIFLHIAYLGR